MELDAWNKPQVHFARKCYSWRPGARAVPNRHIELPERACGQRSAVRQSPPAALERQFSGSRQSLRSLCSPARIRRQTQRATISWMPDGIAFLEIHWQGHVFWWDPIVFDASHKVLGYADAHLFDRLDNCRQRRAENVGQRYAFVSRYPDFLGKYQPDLPLPHSRNLTVTVGIREGLILPPARRESPGKSDQHAQGACGRPIGR